MKHTPAGGVWMGSALAVVVWWGGGRTQAALAAMRCCRIVAMVTPDSRVGMGPKPSGTWCTT